MTGIIGADDRKYTEDDIAFHVAADRKRVAAILAHPAAVGREGLAKVLAMNANLDLDAAVGVLNAARADDAVAPEPEPSEAQLFDWGKAAAIALKGASRIRSRTSTNAEDDEEAGDAAARHLLGLENEDHGSEAENGESLDDVNDEEDRRRRKGQPAAPAAYVPTPADMQAYDEGARIGAWAMANGFSQVR
jgi:hypothetical protein